MIAVFESTVGLPVLTFILFLVWMVKKPQIFLIWLTTISLIISVLWGMAWWLACLFLIFLRVVYQYFGKSVSNKFLKLLLVVFPVGLLFALFLGIDFYWRIVLYAVLSFLVLFVLQKFLLVSYENKYL
ncbi:MAG: hypothetical protein OEX81_01500 [Candidatus Pacebacteria bacterium]|nr:hypothetical protein [Candidatus Paceibacterota bacterium]